MRRGTLGCVGSRLKVYLPVLVVAVVLIGGYLLSTWIRDGGSEAASDASIAAAKKTAASEEAEPSSTPGGTRTRAVTPSSTATSRAGSRGATTPPAAEVRRDLESDENRGGHTLSRHVGRTDAELRQRLKDEPDISAASTYTDQDAAERSVGLALSKNASKVSDWEKANSHPNLVLRVTMPTVIGRSVKSGDSTAKDVKAAVVVLKWAGRDWYVLTSYPEDR